MILHNINLTTLLALFGWPVIALWLYSTRPISQATLWTILGGYLVLPVDAFIKFAMIPQFDKSSIPAFVAFVASILVSGSPFRVNKGFGLVEMLLITLLIVPFISSVLNSDPIVIGQSVLPGVGPYDGASAVVGQFVVLIPFFLGRRFLRNAANTQDILQTLVIAGLVYSLPILLEIRMSPQLHTWIYGYFPSWFSQQMRDGGFRPVVFLGHGLMVAFFMMTTVVAATALWRTRTQVARLPPVGVTAYLGITLALCKAFAALTYGAVLVPLVRWATPRVQLRVATVLVVIALAYPVLRSVDVVPTEFLVEAAELASPERASSLETRFAIERQLLDQASRRFWFGWGRYGRSFIYNARGTETSLTDGYWIITMGQFGFIGFLATFGLLALTVFRASLALTSAVSVKDRYFLAALALIVAINIFDLLPNANIVPWTWLLAGALLGRAEALYVVPGQRVPVRKMAPEMA